MGFKGEHTGNGPGEKGGESFGSGSAETMPIRTEIVSPDKAFGTLPTRPGVRGLPTDSEPERVRRRVVSPMTQGEISRRAAFPHPTTPSLDDVESIVDTRVALGKLHDRQNSNNITRREAQIFTRRYGLGETTPETQQDIGKDFGITRQRVEKLEYRVRLRLRMSGFVGEQPVREGASDNVGTRPRPVTDEQRIVARYREGEGLAEITEALDVDQSVVEQTVREEATRKKT